MTNIKNFKKGDWMIVSIITEGDDGYEINDYNNNLCVVFKNNSKCIVGQNKKYSKYKSWFELSDMDLYDSYEISKEDLIEMYNNKTLEIHRYKKHDNQYWNEYYRSRKDFNYKYFLAKGVNEDWVYFKKHTLEQYIQDVKDCSHMSLITQKFNLEALNHLIEDLSMEIKCKSTFCRGPLTINGTIIDKNENYFDVLLKYYNTLSIKYRRIPDNDFYYILLDFEKVVQYAKLYILSQLEIEIVTLVMNGEKDFDKIADYLNDTFKLKKPITKNDVMFQVDNLIPKLFIKASNTLDSEKCDTNE